MNFHLSYVIYPLAAIYCDFSIMRKLSPLPLVSLNYKQISSKPPCLLNLLILSVASPQLCLPLPTPKPAAFGTKLCLLAERRLILHECVHLPGVRAHCVVSLGLPLCWWFSVTWWPPQHSSQWNGFSYRAVREGLEQIHISPLPVIRYCSLPFVNVVWSWNLLDISGLEVIFCKNSLYQCYSCDSVWRSSGSA